MIRACNSELRLRLQDARRRDAHVVILLERGANQLLQLLVLENFPPLLVSERCRRGIGRFRVRQATIRAGRIYDRAFVIRADHATGKRQHERANGEREKNTQEPPGLKRVLGVPALSGTRATESVWQLLNQRASG